jgi:pimeloyl-ACP methyl ester carboxylesterase
MSTYVLVPGALLGGWVWSKVTPLLESKGHAVHAITITGTGERVHLSSKDIGIETAIHDVLNIVSYNDLSDFVLVGHSFAGKIVAAVADRIPEKVKMLLYLDAFRPEKNRTPQGIFDPAEFGSLKPEEWMMPFNNEILDGLAKDVQGADREWMLSKATPWLKKHWSEPIILSKNFDSVKSAYIFCTHGSDAQFLDDILKGKWGELDGPYRVIESGHYPMVTKPEDLVNDMLELSSS